MWYPRRPRPLRGSVVARYHWAMLRSTTVLIIAIVVAGCNGAVVSDAAPAVDGVLDLLQDIPPGTVESATLVRDYASRAFGADRPEEAARFLSNWVHEHPEDPYNALYLYQIAEYHRRAGEYAPACEYYRRILANYADVVFGGVGVHRQSLGHLAALETDPRRRERVLEALLDRFRDDVDVGKMYYYLARTQEELGRWDESYASYERFLAAPPTRIEGRPDAYDVTRERLAFWRSDRSWVMPTLGDLLWEVRSALDRRDANRLLARRAEVNFFSMAWEQEESDANAVYQFPVSEYLAGRTIRYAGDADLIVNDREAFLRTWGWSVRINTWYLYFRKVDFPADPAIHNGWEWAGIYFGEMI